MASYGDDDGVTNNGFGRRSLHQWEGRLLYMAGYPVPLDFRAPGGWRLSAGGVPIPPPLVGATLDATIDEVLETLSDEQRAQTTTRRGMSSSGAGTNGSSPPTMDLPLLPRATTPAAAP
jgi:hypothetical protein